MGVNKKIIEGQVASAAIPYNTFNVVLYTGNGTNNQDITGVGFQSDLTIIKKRSGSGTAYWGVWDSVRGTGGQLYLSISNAETNTPNRLSSWNSDGFNLGNGVDGEYISTGNWVTYNLKAGGTAVSNTDGDITSSVSANVESGFSIVAYSGNSTANQTIGHGLESAPELILLKERNGNEFWLLHHTGLMTQNQFIYWNTTNAIWTNSKIFGGSPTATTFTVSGGGFDATNTLVNTSGRNYIAYCFHSVEGYQKVGSYTGNGTASTSNPIIDIGFRPDFVMLRELDTTGSLTRFFDTVRGGTGQNNKQLSNDTAGEYTGLDSTDYIKFEDDGFRVTTGNSDYNESGKDYMFLAIKINPSPQPSTGNMSFLVVAGGGGAGGSDGGGAGAGGLRTSYGPTSGGGSSSESDITLAAGTYTITVGAAGSGAVGYNTTTPTSGGNSSIAGSGLTTITSTGGGRGGMYNHVNGAPEVGGSGGGSGGESNASNNPAAGTANQGFAGGQYTGSNYHGGGGGGASEAGNTDAAGEGGDGLSVAITGSAVAYAGGGAGGGIGGTTTGGTGGGGNSAVGGGNVSGSAGSTNTGGGGGAGGDGGSSQGGAGGSGVVILKLLTSEYSGTTTGSPTVTTDGDYSILKYTGSGTYVHS
jgi:hypothetical protein